MGDAAPMATPALDVDAMSNVAKAKKKRKKKRLMAMEK